MTDDINNNIPEEELPEGIIHCFSGSKAGKFHELTPFGWRTPSVRPASPSLPCVGWK